MDDRMKRILLSYLMLYGWRDEYECEYGVDPNDFETEEEFLKARDEACEEYDG